MKPESHKEFAIPQSSANSGLASQPSSESTGSLTSLMPKPARKPVTSSIRKRYFDLPVKLVSSYDADLVPVFHGSPWKSYKQDLSLDQGGSVAVVYKTPATKELFTIRSISGPDAEEQVFMLRQLRHENLLVSHELYSFENKFFVVSELAAISLEELTVAGPDEIQLAAIAYQVRFSSI